MFLILVHTTSCISLPQGRRLNPIVTCCFLPRLWPWTWVSASTPRKHCTQIFITSHTGHFENITNAFPDCSHLLKSYSQTHIWLCHFKNLNLIYMTQLLNPNLAPCSQFLSLHAHFFLQFPNLLASHCSKEAWIFRHLLIEFASSLESACSLLAT